MTIPEDVYEELKRDARVLSTLRAYGVDNWSGYDDAIRATRDQSEDDQ